jgi:uncharacterized protein involved in response to NO
MRAPATAGRRQGAPLLLSIPHRFFFLAGVAAIALAALWWAWALAARAWPAIPPPGASAPEPAVHALVMIAGFAPFFMFGFLFTAGPRWLDTAPPGPPEWLPAGVVAAVSALLLVPIQVAGVGAIALRVDAGLYAVAWLVLALRFHALIRASDAPDRVHATIVLGGLLCGASCVAAFALAGPAAQAWVRVVGVWAFLVPVFVTVCHRMIPFFTSSALPFVKAFRPWWLLVLMLAAALAHAVFVAAGADGWSWLVDLPAGALLLWVAIRWGVVQSLANRLLAMLHLGFVWYGFGLVLAGASSLLQLAGGAGLGLAPLHAVTIGFASSLLMAMVTRVTCGHSGRTLAADAHTWRLFLLLQASAVARVAAELAPVPGALAAAALLFAAALVPWCAKYAPVYWRVRIDGRPG